MARYVTTVRTERPAAEVFAFMADLRNFARWDPGVSRVAQVEGEGGGLGTTFDVDVTTAGRTSTLRYETTTYDPPHEVVVRAGNRLLTSVDRVTVVEGAGSTVVTYDADLRLRGILAIGELGLRLAFRRIGDRAAAGLRDALDGVEVR